VAPESSFVDSIRDDHAVWRGLPSGSDQLVAEIVFDSAEFGSLCEDE
jgi:hypothetical protein